jgi:hypothetical protein
MDAALMSDDASHPGGSASTDSSHAHAHDPPPPPEPQTPMWLPAVGVALFVTVALWWAVTPKAPVPAPPTDAPVATASAAPGQPQPQGAAGSVRTADGGVDPSAVQRLLDRLPK